MARRIGTVLLVACHAAALLLVLFSGEASLRLQADRIGPDQGLAYVAALPFETGALYRIASDGPGAGQASRLRLTENGRPLGPAHAAHATIRQTGGGAYSHWNGSLWFSSSDGTDPRGNGRIYAASAPRQVPGALLAGLAGLDLIAAFLARRLLARIARRMASSIALPIAAALAAAAPALMLGPAMLGLSPPLGRGAPLADGIALASAILGHALLGLCMAAAIWLPGMGVAVLIAGRAAPLGLTLALGFPAGLVLAGASAALVLVVPGGAAIAGLLLPACAVALLRWRLPREERATLWRTALAASGLALALAIAFGMAWRGPEAGSPSTLSGDMNYFTGLMVNLATSPFPFRNLGNEGEHVLHVGTLFFLLGATAFRLFGIDPSLFLSASGGAFHAISLVLAIVGFLKVRGARLDRLGVCLIVAGAVAAGRYPSWIPESPSVNFAVPLGLSILSLAIAREGVLVSRVAALAVAFLATVVSKVAAGLVFTLIALAGAVGDLRRLSRRALLVLGILSLPLGALGLALLAIFGPGMVKAFGLGPESIDNLLRWQMPWTQAWPYVARDLSPLVMIAALIGPLPLLFTAAIAAALVTGTLVKAFLGINFVIGLLVAALLLAVAAPSHRLARRLGLLSVLLCLPAMLLTDPAGLETTVPLAWAIAISGCALLACLAAAPQRPASGRLAEALTTAAIAVPVAALVTLAAFASGAYRPLPAQHGSPSPITASVADIWRAVRETTPADALIFTDQTGDEPTLLGGWNTFSATGGRQVFLSNYYQSGELRTDTERRDAKLTINRRVLAGELAPGQAGLRRSYGSYFAVVAGSTPMPANFRLQFRNADWALYRIEPRTL